MLPTKFSPTLTPHLTFHSGYYCTSPFHRIVSELCPHKLNILVPVALPSRALRRHVVKGAQWCRPRTNPTKLTNSSGFILGEAFEATLRRYLKKRRSRSLGVESKAVLKRIVFRTNASSRVPGSIPVQRGKVTASVCPVCPRLNAGRRIERPEEMIVHFGFKFRAEDIQAQVNCFANHSRVPFSAITSCGISTYCHRLP